MFFTLARNYAQSLYDLDPKCLTALQKLAQASQDQHFIRFVQDPATHPTEILEAFFSVSPKTKVLTNFLTTLIDKKRTGLLPQIAEAFAAIEHHAENTVPVSIVAAQTLNPKSKKLAQTVAHKLIGLEKKPHYQFLINKDLISACQIHYGDNVFDLSLQNQCHSLEQYILGVNYD